MFRYSTCLLLALPGFIFGTYHVQPLPLKGTFQFLRAASPAGHLVIEESARGERFCLHTPEGDAIEMPRTRHPQAVNSEGIVAGTYKVKGSHSPRFYVFDSRSHLYTDLPPLPFPKDWMIEEVDFLHVMENGEVVGSLFLDMIHADDFFIDPAASLFEGELINFAYNVHTKEMRYFVKSGVYSLQKNKLSKLKNKAPEYTWEPFLHPRRYIIREIDSQGIFYGEDRGEDQDQIRFFAWSQETGFTFLPGSDFPLISALFKNEGLLLPSDVIVYAINDNNEIVGANCLQGCSELHAFIWTHEAGIQDLNDLIDQQDPTINLRQALHISHQGVILGIDENDCAYRLFPAKK